MLRYLIIILALTMLAPLGAELVITESWNYTDNPNGTEEAESSAISTIELPGGDILTVGYKSTFYDGDYVEYPFVIRHNSAGEIVWGNTYALDDILEYRTRAIYAKRLDNGNIFIGCTSQGNSWGAYVMTINPTTAQVISHNLYDYVPVNYCSVTGTGSYYAYRNYGSGSSTYIDIRLFSSAGVQIGTATTVSSVGMENNVKSLVACSDGGYLLAGSRGSDGLLVRFNNSMEVVWEQTYTGDGTGTQVLNYAVQTASGMIYATGKDDSEGLILRATYSGVQVWQHFAGSTEFISVCETADGNCVAAGAYAIPFNPRNYLVMYTPTGEFIYTDSTFDYYGWYNSVIKAGTHGFVAVGWRNDHSGTYYSDVTINYFEGYIDNAIVVTQVLPFEPNPTNNTINVMATDSQAFSISASDPDGHSLNYSWMLDGVEVSTSSSYTFVSELAQAGESFMLFLFVNDETRSSVMYNWQINVTEYINPPYAPYPNMPYDNATGFPIDFSPSLSWNYSMDESHTQDRSVLYLSTNQQAVTDMSFTCKVQDDGTLHDSYSFTMLPNQTYYWRVVAYNGTQSTASDVWSFSTESIISSFPYTQDFEGGFLPPSGWFNYVSSGLAVNPQPGMGGGWGNAWDSQYIHSGDGAIMCTPYQMPQYYWLLTPFFNIRSSSQLHFWVNYLCTENPTELHVMIKTAAGWQVLYSFDSPAESNVYASEVTLPLGAYYGQNARIAFVYNCNSLANIVAVDDFSITADAALPIPQNVEIVKSGTQVQLSWDSASAEELFKVYASSSPEGSWTLVSGVNGFSRVGNRTFWSTSISDKAFYHVTRYTP